MVEGRKILSCVGRDCKAFKFLGMLKDCILVTISFYSARNF